MSDILFFSEDLDYSLKNKNNIRIWIQQVVDLNSARKISGINYIFCTDNYLFDLNNKFLNHDTLTDIITFDHSEDDNQILADIYISIDRIKENSRDFNHSLEKELHRVMIHGILHLLGYKDSTPYDKAIMRKKENECLTLLKI